MTRDNGERLELYSRQGVEVRRIALNMDQIEQYDPPPNPVKGSDSRWRKYAEEHGNNSWELDALEPKVLDDLIQDAITTHVDMDKWDEAVREEDEKRADLAKLHERWPELQRLVNIEGKPLDRLERYDDEVPGIADRLSDAVDELPAENLPSDAYDEHVLALGALRELTQ